MKENVLLEITVVHRMESRVRRNGKHKMENGNPYLQSWKVIANKKSEMYDVFQ